MPLLQDRVYQDTYDSGCISLKGTESWDLKTAMTETFGGCNLKLMCDGKGRSTIPILVTHVSALEYGTHQSSNQT